MRYTKSSAWLSPGQITLDLATQLKANCEAEISTPIERLQVSVFQKGRSFYVATCLVPNEDRAFKNGVGLMLRRMPVDQQKYQLQIEAHYSAHDTAEEYEDLPL